jgi:SAM-dependent methyltransferase
MREDRLVPLAKRLTDLSVDDIWDFYQNAYLERELGKFSPEEEAKIFDYKLGLGNMSSRRAYYRQAYCRQVHRAVYTIFSHYEHPRLLDVCCGTGTQALLFSFLGASVVGIDHDPGQLQVLRKRMETYTHYFPKRVNIVIKQADVRSQSFAELGMFDVVYSHIGVGHVMSADDVFLQVADCLEKGGLVILKNSNPQCAWLRAVGKHPPVSTRREYLRCAERYGFKPLIVQGTTAIPRRLWFLGGLTPLPDAVLKPLVILQISIEYIFEKTA